MKKRLKLDPPKVLVLGFGGIIIIGAILLMMPIGQLEQLVPIP